MTAKEQREARLAAQLRANLRRRKAAAAGGNEQPIVPDRQDNRDPS